MMPIQLSKTLLLVLLFLLVTPVWGADEDRGRAKYTCPMHPHYIADETGACPICGMDLVKLESESVPDVEGEEAAGGRGMVTIPSETIQNMGVRYGRPEVTVFGRRIRAYGVVAENERLRSEVSSRVAGWIESLVVTAVGDKVKNEVVYSTGCSVPTWWRLKGIILAVWVNAAVAEKDLVLINTETEVRIILPKLPGRIIETRVDYIHPTVDRSSRTGTVRMLLDNTDNLLRLGAYADVLFEVGLDRRLAVPDSALLLGADGPYLVVALGNGRFQPRKVRTGLSSGGFTEVIEGIDKDQRIVVSGQFLIDSESALREYYREKQVRLFKNETDGRLWVQQGDRPFSPYGDDSDGVLVQ